MGRLIAMLDEALNRGKYKKIKGLLAMLGLLVLVYAICLIPAFIDLFIPLGWIIELFAIASLLAFRSLHQHVKAVANGLAHDIHDGRLAVSHIVGRDVSALDEHGVARACVESLAESFCDGVVAPFFYAALFGLPGIALYKLVNTADSMIGHKDARYREFGWAAARLDDVLNFIPARIAALLIVLAAAMHPRARWRASLRMLMRDHAKHDSPNAGWPEAAMAGALGLQLAGPVSYDGEMMEKPYIGEGRREATIGDIRSALHLYEISAILLVLTGLLAMWPV